MSEAAEATAEAWSSEGPECPNCGETLVPDDREFFEEDLVWDHECTCGATFSVQVSISMSWQTHLNPKEPTND